MTVGGCSVVVCDGGFGILVLYDVVSSIQLVVIFSVEEDFVVNSIGVSCGFVVNSPGGGCGFVVN